MNKLPKILDYKTYNSIPHLSKSRLGESDSTIDMNSELKMTNKFPHQHCALYVQEKMDGSNVCIVRINGELRALGRSGYDCSNSDQEQHQMFYRYMIKHKDYFEKLLPNDHDRLVGEWCALAHGTIYKDLKIPFWPFDLYLNKVQQGISSMIVRMQEAGDYKDFCRMPTIVHMEGPISIDDALALLDKYRPDAEGLIYRLEVRNKPYLIAKVVKMDKVDGKYFKDENNVTIDKSLYTWNWRDDE